jgi:hypothetical protein
MKSNLQKTILPILLTTVWISISEFFRNEMVLKSFWINHYQNLGLVFPDTSVNGMIWGVWSFVFAISIFILAKKFSMVETFFFSWFMFFVSLWLVIGNLNVLPFGILYSAIPLSLFESFIATLIVKKFQ